MARDKLNWQSKLILLLTMPAVGTALVLQTQWWATQDLSVAIWTIGLSLLLALVVLKLRAATMAGAVTGAALTANLMFSTVSFPYQPWRTAMPAVLSVSILAWLATRIGRGRKERLGTAESRFGRAASQIAANLGVAALVALDLVQSWLADSPALTHSLLAGRFGEALALAALAEAAADTVSSELGQVFGGRPRMLTTFRTADPGTDGAISVAGTAAGVAAGAMVAALGAACLSGGIPMFGVAVAGSVFGLFFDSLLGATLERRRWLNNDAVNFLSTGSAAAFAFAMLLLRSHIGGH